MQMTDKSGPARGRAARAAGAAAVVLAALTVAGCGGGGGSGSEPAAAVPDPGASSPVRVAAEIRSTLLESSSQAVRAVTADIDDAGRVLVVYSQRVGDRLALLAVAGEPGPRGGQPAFGAPDEIDAAVPHDSALGEFSVVVSPRGHALASWVRTAPCAADSYRSSGDCRFVVTARRLAGQGWEAPVQVGDMPTPLPRAIINDNGDVAMMWSGRRRSDSGTLTQFGAVVVMPAAASRFNPPALFTDIESLEGGLAGLALDRSGNLVYVTTAQVGPHRQLVARRGPVTGSFGATERLDSVDADATIESVSGGANGQVVVLWQQRINGSVHRLAAALDAPGQAWSVSDLGSPGVGQRSLSALGDNGDFLRYDLDTCTALRRTAGTWHPATALPAGLCQASPSFVAALSRGGDVIGGLFSTVQPAGNTGQWLAYSAARNLLTQPLGDQAADLLLGTRSTLGGQLLLAENGVAALVSTSSFDTLPSATAPAGAPGTAANLWLTYLRLP